MNYATLYWKEDLLGIILVDAALGDRLGTPIVVKPSSTTNTYNLTTQLATLKATGDWANPTYGLTIAQSDLIFATRYGLANPNSTVFDPDGNPIINPLTNKTYSNWIEYFASAYEVSFRYTNITGGYGDALREMQLESKKDQWWPRRLNRETLAMTDWTNCPYVTRDFDEYYREIGTPLIAINSGITSNRSGTLRFVNGINTTDFTTTLVPNTGIFNLSVGNTAVRDVFAPTYQWLMGELTGLKATAFCDVTVMPGWAWYFFARSTGGAGAHTYQWFEGTTMLQGQTSMVLPITKNMPGVYYYYCRVTDSQGATTSSNAVTLTVR